MPGDRKHHTDKFRRCVEQVMEKGHEEDSAYAICTTSMQKAGEPLFEGAESRSAEEFKLLSEYDGHLDVATLHTLHLLGATGTSYTALYNNRPHLVVPVVALMEGVIHAVNADTPEFVPLETLRKAAASWNGKPVMLGHPVKNGKQCSANYPEMEAQRLGTIFNSRIEGTKLLQEAWIDEEKGAKLHPSMMANLKANKTEEVSVGAFVFTSAKTGEFKGKKYKGEWLETSGDHLAFLPGGRGACSVAMGCGTHRAAMQVLEDRLEDAMPEVSVISVLEGQSLDDRIRAVNMAIDAKWNKPMSAMMSTPNGYCYAKQIFDDHVIVEENGKELYSVPYTVGAEGTVEFGEPVRVKQEYVAAKMGYEDCPTCNGSGNKDGNPCPTCDGKGEIIKAAAGTRRAEQPLTQTGTKELRAACSCQEKHTMANEQQKKKAEVIAALVDHKFSGFKQGDEAMLEAASDARLEEMRTAADSRETAAQTATKAESDLVAANARVTVLEGKLKAAEQAPTEEQWLEKAPAGIKILLENQKAKDTEERESLIKQLKIAAANTEDELKAMSTDQLKTLAKYANLEQPDFSGKGTPAQRAAASSNATEYAPPDPYAAGLKQIRAAQGIS